MPAFYTKIYAKALVNVKLADLVKASTTVGGGAPAAAAAPAAGGAAPAAAAAAAPKEEEKEEEEEDFGGGGGLFGDDEDYWTGYICGAIKAVLVVSPFTVLICVWNRLLQEDFEWIYPFRSLWQSKIWTSVERGGGIREESLQLLISAIELRMGDLTSQKWERAHFHF